MTTIGMTQHTARKNDRALSCPLATLNLSKNVASNTASRIVNLNALNLFNNPRAVANGVCCRRSGNDVVTGTYSPSPDAFWTFAGLNADQLDFDGNGLGNACDPVFDADEIPTASAWGVVIAGLFLLAVGTLAIRGRRVTTVVR